MRGAQSGSVLVAVLAISVILTAAAAGFLALGVNGVGVGADSRRLTQTYYAAESGLNMGVRWLKHYDEFFVKNYKSNVKNFGLPDSFVVTRGPRGWSDFDSVQVKVVIDTNTTNAYFELTSKATLGLGMDTVLLKLRVANVASGSPKSSYTGVLNTWTETLIPGK